jgi:hypothetical protein
LPKSGLDILKAAFTQNPILKEIFLGGQMPLFLFFDTQTMHFKSALLRFYQKNHTSAGFEPGSSVPEAEAMSVAPRLHKTFLFPSRDKNVLARQEFNLCDKR